MIQFTSKEANFMRMFHVRGRNAEIATGQQNNDQKSKYCSAGLGF